MIRGFPPYTYTHTAQRYGKPKQSELECVAGGTARSLPDTQENASLDQNNSASQIFFPFITLVAYFTFTGHNNVMSVYNT